MGQAGCRIQKAINQQDEIIQNFWGMFLLCWEVFLKKGFKVFRERSRRGGDAGRIEEESAVTAWRLLN